MERSMIVACSMPLVDAARSKLDERVINESANRLVTQRICLLAASLAAAEGAEAGYELTSHALQLAEAGPASRQVAIRVHKVASRSSCAYWHLV